MAGNDIQIILNTLATETPWSIFVAADLVTKLCLSVCLLMFVAALVLAFNRRMSRGRRSVSLNAVRVIGLIAGIVGSTYTAFEVWMVWRRLHLRGTTPFLILLPEIIGAAYLYLCVALLWFVVSVGNACDKRA